MDRDKPRAIWIDLNADLGEGSPHDAAIMPYLSSANIACGAHAGDAETMRLTVRLALRHGVAVGAHPGWPDRPNFGRVELSRPPAEVEALVCDQIAVLAEIARAEGGRLAHVKPHGALYNQAAREPGLAEAIARAVQSFDASLILVGLAGSVLVEAGRALGLRVFQEAFPDRAYEPDGSLRARSLPGAVRESPEEIAAAAVRLAVEGIRIGGAVLRPDTLCLHGDHPRAAENARAVRAALERAGVGVGCRQQANVRAHLRGLI